MSTTEAQQPNTAQALPPIGWDSAGIRMTPEEFDAVDEYDELYRYELINDVLVVLPICDEAEADANEHIGYYLFCYRDRPNAIDIETLQNRYIFLERDRRLVGRVIWAGLGRMPKPKLDPPTIVLDFVREGKRGWIRDYDTKRDQFLAASVKEYWIIDRFDRTMTVYTPGDDGPQIRVVKEDEIYQTDLLPGFELALAEILAVADQWTHLG